MEPKVTTEHHRGSATIFKNPFLESLTKTSLKQNIIVYGLVVLLLIYNGIFIQKIPVLTFTGLFIFALFFWTFAEYMLHRYLFHWISENKFVQRFHFIMHGSHHLYPRDTERLLMPPVPGLIMASILFAIFYGVFSILGQPVLTWGFFPGFFLGYLLYSFLHRATHVVKPPKRFKFLWKHHSLHHYKYPDKAFGVSNTLWDHVFGTMPPKKSYK
ncbi:sterol desaturase family protein [Lutimonas saemankumensis]|uniref:sterol desaturase family protein n=1 Tax=Lutimonas saemankumensis TaxID=483016 RepID=UPI001CD3D19D|nr:sterol desaturase family protein [Lutimonas saemankumensis]MCA0932000.1 sterol desaturase family protein [Lutimonas saemankumensis]